QEPELEPGHLVEREADHAGDLHSVRGHPLRVLAGVGIARFDRVGQRRDRRRVRALELLGARALLLEGLPQVGGVALELTLLQRSLLLSGAERRAEPLDLLDQLGLAADRHRAQRIRSSRSAASTAAAASDSGTTSMPSRPIPGGVGPRPSENRIAARRRLRPRRSSAWSTACGLRTPTSTSATSNRRS